MTKCVSLTRILQLESYFCRNANKDFVKYVIQDYDKPMGVATFDTLSEMPEKLQKALPDIEELKKLL